ncbi:MAG: TraB/GumN family protein [Emcibacter sp.]|nr:TraB/GumN family protein [Emcibacter sp.]
MIYNGIGSISRRYLIRFITAVFFSFVVFPTVLLAKDGDIVQAKPALWVVEKGQNKTYLLGSFHLLPKNYTWYDGIIKMSFEASDELVLETDIDPKATAEIQGLVIKNGFFQDGDTLKNHLDSAHYQKMLKHAKGLMGVDEVMAAKSKPWFMAVQLSVVSIMSIGMDPASGVDVALQSKAMEKGKPIHGLETPTEQMMALIDHPLKVQSEMLEDTLDKLDDFQSYIASYLAAWASGDSDKISDTMVNDMAKHKEMYKALLVDRNNNWLPIVEGYINSEKNIFIVVGAAHLVGKDGLVNMLKEKGYKVEKVQ